MTQDEITRLFLLASCQRAGMALNEYHAAATWFRRNNVQRLLVIGVGLDTYGWTQLWPGDRHYFIETSPKWARRCRKLWSKRVLRWDGREFGWILRDLFDRGFRPDGVLLDGPPVGVADSPGRGFAASLVAELLCRGAVAAVHDWRRQHEVEVVAPLLPKPIRVVGYKGMALIRPEAFEQRKQPGK